MQRGRNHWGDNRDGLRPVLGEQGYKVRIGDDNDDFDIKDLDVQDRQQGQQ
ncbi:hypothetical protein [Variovorax boronicumulans]|uniref:hypothetical protein n=1 Tax=Variovorax boronicumulans TaxID=436515 RepID=UPI000A93F364|nr:hypothetical protein [Variovorax boronicumulans]